MKLFILLGLLLLGLSQNQAKADIDLLVGGKACQKKNEILDMKISIVVNNRQYNDERDDLVLRKYIRMIEIGSCKKSDCFYCGFPLMSIKDNKIFIKQDSKMIELGTIPENLEPYLDSTKSSTDYQEYASLPLKLSEEFVVKSAKLKKKYSIHTKGDIFDRSFGHGFSYYSLKIIQQSTGRTIDFGY